MSKGKRPIWIPNRSGNFAAIRKPNPSSMPSRPRIARDALWWVVSAKKEETRQTQLTKLIADSASGRTLPALSRPLSR
jgi:hypothetical protein